MFYNFWLLSYPKKGHWFSFSKVLTGKNDEAGMPVKVGVDVTELQVKRGEGLESESRAGSSEIRK